MTTLVVAGAILDRDRGLLLARRRRPSELAGLWELPGGKAEAGETRADALRRELREELGVQVEVGEALRAHVALRSGVTLVALRAQVVEGVPEPRDHSELSWVGAPALRSMAADGRLVPADEAWVPELLDLLEG